MTEAGKTNPFATSEAWSPSGGILPPGDYVLEIESIDGTGTSSGGYPQLEVDLSSEEGSIRDWLVTIESAAGKVTALIEAAGVETPTDAQVMEDGTGYRFDGKYLQQLAGKKVGVRIRQEPHYNDPTKMRTVVAGYLTPDKINTDLPADTSDLKEQVGAVGRNDDDIPF